MLHSRLTWDEGGLTRKQSHRQLIIVKNVFARCQISIILLSFSLKGSLGLDSSIIFRRSANTYCWWWYLEIEVISFVFFFRNYQGQQWSMANSSWANHFALIPLPSSSRRPSSRFLPWGQCRSRCRWGCQMYIWLEGHFERLPKR